MYISGSTRCSYYYQQRRKKIYTQGHGSSMYIRMGSASAATTSGDLTGKYTQDMAFLHVYIRKEKYTPRDMAFLVYIRMGSHAVLPLATTSSLCHKRIHPGTWHSSMYNQNGICGACTSYYQQLVPQGEIYQGHGIPPCI
jgi:hypothetical protein